MAQLASGAPRSITIFEVAVALAVATLCVSCSEQRVCAPGATQSCVCSGSTKGAQSCGDDGMGWNACACDAVLVAEPPVAAAQPATSVISEPTGTEHEVQPAAPVGRGRAPTEEPVWEHPLGSPQQEAARVPGTDRANDQAERGQPAGGGISPEAVAEAKALIGTPPSGEAARDVSADMLAGGAVVGQVDDVLANAAKVGVPPPEPQPRPALRAPSASTPAAAAPPAEEPDHKTKPPAPPSLDATSSSRQVRGRVSLGSGGDIGGSGSFDAQTVVVAIKKRMGAIRSCYESELKARPTLTGKLTVRFTIQPGGQVSGAHAAGDTVGSSALTACVAGLVKAFRFSPGPEGGSVTYSYPFVFAPES